MTAGSLDDLKAEMVEFVQSVDWDNSADRLSAMSMLDYYNGMVPSELQIGRSPVLTVSLNAETSAHQIESALSGLTRAVTFIAKEFRDQNSAARLTGPDYAKTPLIPVLKDKTIMLTTPFRPGTDLVGGDQDEAQVALRRLVAILPESQQAAINSDAVMSLRAHSRQAALAIAKVATRSGGLTMEVSDTPQDNRAEVDEHYAKTVEDLLEVDEVRAERVPMKGFLEGARTHRRKFYLERVDGESIEGTFDEAIVRDVASLLNRDVSATVEVVTVQRRSGAAVRPVYRLVHVSAWSDPQALL